MSFKQFRTSLQCLFVTRGTFANPRVADQVGKVPENKVIIRFRRNRINDIVEELSSQGELSDG
jgi:hypothetical protein